MRLPTLISVHYSRRQALATTLIGVGLLTLIVSPFWSGAPVVTAMAIIALGATEITLSRFRGNAALLPVVILHSMMYASLYALFVGATLHSSNAHSASDVGTWSTLDLAVSVLPVVFLMRRILRGLRQSILSQP